MAGKLFGKKYNMKCYGSATVGERGQIVLPAEIRKQYEISPGHKLIVMGGDYGGMRSIALMKSEDLAKMFEYMTEMEKMVSAGGESLETLKKEGLRKIKAVRKSGIGGMQGKRVKKKK